MLIMFTEEGTELLQNLAYKNDGKEESYNGFPLGNKVIIIALNFSASY